VLKISIVLLSFSQNVGFQSEIKDFSTKKFPTKREFSYNFFSTAQNLKGKCPVPSALATTLLWIANNARD